jgi:hypothetical protein
VEADSRLIECRVYVEGNSSLLQSLPGVGREGKEGFDLLRLHNYGLLSNLVQPRTPPHIFDVSDPMIYNNLKGGYHYEQNSFHGKSRGHLCVF